MLAVMILHSSVSRKAGKCTTEGVWPKTGLEKSIAKALILHCHSYLLSVLGDPWPQPTKGKMRFDDFGTVKNEG